MKLTTDTSPNVSDGLNIAVASMKTQIYKLLCEQISKYSRHRSRKSRALSHEEIMDFKG